MKNRIWGLVRVAAVLFLFQSGAGAIEGQSGCKQELTQAGAAKLLAKRKLEDIAVLNLLTYNLLNLDTHVGKFERGATGFNQIKGPRKKGDPFREWQANIVLEEQTDIGVFQEVEGHEAFRNFNDDYFHGRYNPLMVSGNDQRGIQVGMFVKQDLPFEIEYRNHIDHTWIHPETGRETRVFSRDLPALILRVKGNPKPLLIILGTHYKSKRDSDGDPLSNTLRKGQADATVEVIRNLKREFGESVPFVLGGDFNGNFNKEESFAAMRKALDMEDPFNVLKVPEAERVTHTYHPRRGRTQNDQIDYLLVSQSIQTCIKAAYVHRYKDDWGKVKRLPRSMEERKQNPSDHFPVVMKLDFQCVLNYWRSLNR